MKVQQNKTIPTAEIKLGLNLAKEIVKAVSSDTKEERELKQTLIDIDKVLKSGDEDRIWACNRMITQKYGYILFNPSTTFRGVTEAEWRSLTFFDRYYSMRSIGETLKVALSLKKYVTLLGGAAKAAGEYAYDKSLESLKQEK